MLQPRLPNPDRFPFPLVCSFAFASFSQARPPVFARAEGVLLGLLDEQGDGFDEVDEVEQGQENGRGDAADSGAAVEGADGSRGSQRLGRGREVRGGDGRELREE